MKLKAILTIMASLAVYNLGYGQLKVHPSGKVSVGTTNSYPGYEMQVHGDNAGVIITRGEMYLRLSSAPTSSGYYAAAVGSSNDQVTFYTSVKGHNKVFFQDFTKISDSCRKENIVEINNPLETIVLLNPVQYNLRIDSMNSEEQIGYGFIAQEVSAVLPEIVDTNEGVLGIRIDEIIPFLVAGMQEQQLTIDSLLERVTELEKCDCKIKKKSQESSEESMMLTTVPAELGQNVPNPFNELTVINYVIPESASSAQIIIYDLNGAQLEKFDLRPSGAGQLTIDSKTFRAGMYIYALLVDGQYVDSKRMILTE